MKKRTIKDSAVIALVSALMMPCIGILSDSLTACLASTIYIVALALLSASTNKGRTLVKMAIRASIHIQSILTSYK